MLCHCIWTYMCVCMQPLFHLICCNCFRFLMCYLVYTNYQSQGAVINMTAGEVFAVEESGQHCMVNVWEHKTAATYGSARIVMPSWVYSFLKDYCEAGNRSGTDLVFQTASGAKLTHMSIELERFSELFSKRFAVTPKAIATVVGLGSSEAEAFCSGGNGNWCSHTSEALQH